MATVKAICGKQNNTLKGGLKKIIDYVTNDKKAEDVTGINCEPETALDEMETTKHIYNKTNGTQYYHFIVSWHPDENISTNLAKQIITELVEQLPFAENFECIIAIHNDRKHKHGHIVFNSVNLENGKKMQVSPKDLQLMKDITDDLCYKYGLSVTEKGKTFEGKKRTETSTYTKEAYWTQQQSEKKNIQSYVRGIAKNVLKARNKAVDRDDFINRLKNNDIGVIWTDKRKYITFIDLKREQAGEKKFKVRDKTINEYFNINITKDTLEQDFNRNKTHADNKSSTNQRTFATSIANTQASITQIKEQRIADAKEKQMLKTQNLLKQTGKIIQNIKQGAFPKSRDLLENQISVLRQTLNEIKNSNGMVNLGIDMTRASRQAEIEAAINTLQSSLSSEMAKEEASIALNGL